MSLVSHEKSYLVCFELNICATYSTFFSKAQNWDSQQRAETAAISNFEISSISRNIYVQIRFTGGEKIQKMISILDTTEFAAYILPFFKDNQPKNHHHNYISKPFFNLRPIGIYIVHITLFLHKYRQITFLVENYSSYTSWASSMILHGVKKNFAVRVCTKKITKNWFSKY